VAYQVAQVQAAEAAGVGDQPVAGAAALPRQERIRFP